MEKENQTQRHTSLTDAISHFADRLPEDMISPPRLMVPFYHGPSVAWGVSEVLLKGIFCAGISSTIGSIQASIHPLHAHLSQR